MLDSVDYAANAGVVPAIACMGEKDVFFQAHVIMGEAMAKEGLDDGQPDLARHRARHRPDDARGADAADRRVRREGLDRRPEQIRFVTWTLKYSRCHWLQVLGLERALRPGRAGGAAGTDERGRGRGAEERHALRHPAAGDCRRRPQSRVGGTTDLRFRPSWRDCGSRWHRRRQARVAVGRPGRARRPTRRQAAGLAGADRRRVHGAVPVRPRHRQRPGTRPCRRGPTRACSGSPTSGTATSAASCRSRRTTPTSPKATSPAHLILFGDPGSNSWIAKVAPAVCRCLDAAKRCNSAAEELPGGDHAPGADRSPTRCAASGRALRRPQQRPHVPRGGAGEAQLSAVSRAGATGPC